MNRSILVAGGAAVLSLASCASTASTQEFEVRNEFELTIPEGASNVRAWFALPGHDAAQEVSHLAIEAPFATREVHDALGNRFLYMEASAPRAGTLDPHASRGVCWQGMR